MVFITYCVVFLFCFSSSCVPYVASVSGLSFFHCPLRYSLTFIYLSREGVVIFCSERFSFWKFYKRSIGKKGVYWSSDFNRPKRKMHVSKKKKKIPQDMEKVRFHIYFQNHFSSTSLCNYYSFFLYYCMLKTQNFKAKGLKVQIKIQQFVDIHWPKREI